MRAWTYLYYPLEGKPKRKLQSFWTYLNWLFLGKIFIIPAGKKYEVSVNKGSGYYSIYSRSRKTSSTSVLISIPDNSLKTGPTEGI